MVFLRSIELLEEFGTEQAVAWVTASNPEALIT